MDVDDLMDKVRYYLRHDEEREAIAWHAYQRSLAEHTFARRLSDLISHVERDPTGWKEP